MACTICGRDRTYHGSEHPNARAGGYLIESGCHDGVWMDDDEYSEGWQPDVIYPPCPHSPLRCRTCNGTGEALPDAERDDCSDCHGTGWRGGQVQWPMREAVDSGEAA